MNINQTNTKFSFPAIESIINRPATFILNLTFSGLLLFLFLLFVLGPVYGIYKRGWSGMIYTVFICWGISLLILIPATRHYMMRRKRIASKIIVNSTGLLFYNSKNEVVHQILYTELRPSKQNFDIYTVTPIGSGIVPLLEITIQQEKTEATIRRIDMNLPLHVVKNKFILYALFMQGISIFRPDLKIDPMALKSFSIDPDTWEFNNKGTSRGGWLVILAVLTTLGLILGLVFLLT